MKGSIKANLTRDKRIAELWREGKTLARIAELLAVTQGHVESRIRVLRKRGVAIEWRAERGNRSRAYHKRAAETEPLEIRACNICGLEKPMSHYQRFCDACRHTGRVHDVASGFHL